MLLILAGVALATLTGQGNIIGNAENAVGKYNNSVEREQQLLNEIEKYFIVHANGEELPPVNEYGLANKDITIKPDEDNDTQIVIPKGFAPAILATGTTQSGPGEDGSVASIMPYEQWNNITVEDINKGIVIVDHAITYDSGKESGEIPDFNEFVWVSIPDSRNFARVPWNGPYFAISPSNGEHPLSDEQKEDYFWENDTISEYQNMINSVKNNKGFYIGRYEASNNTNGIAQSKRNQDVWKGVSQVEAIEACKNSTTENLHLMYGIEWDSTLNWLIGNAIISSSTTGNIKTMEIGDIQTNSSNWGNYHGSTGDAAINSGDLQKTGYNESWKANNIYDLAGNIWEQTQEEYSTSNNNVIRGGNSSFDGTNYPAAHRDDNSEGYIYASIIGFRISFFI